MRADGAAAPCDSLLRHAIGFCAAALMVTIQVGRGGRLLHSSEIRLPVRGPVSQTPPPALAPQGGLAEARGLLVFIHAFSFSLIQMAAVLSHCRPGTHGPPSDLG